MQMPVTMTIEDTLKEGEYLLCSWYDKIGVKQFGWFTKKQAKRSYLNATNRKP